MYIIENFRETCSNAYNLDYARFYAVSGIARITATK